MHPELTKVIEAFRRAQDAAVATLREKFGVHPPASNLEWAKAGDHLSLQERAWEAGIKVRAHGYGVEIRVPGLVSDFDWGERGEANGFDTWRLWNHCLENRLFLDTVTYDLLKTWLDEAYSASEVVKDRHLYYLPRERTCDPASH